MAAPSFYILDGHYQIYRSYFAPMRELTGPNGEPTKGIFVFLNMLLGFIERRKPDYLCMVIDEGSEEGVFRKQIASDYKANRSARPDDFGPQEARILQAVRDAGIPLFGKPGFEADDVIATMSRQLCTQGFDTFLVSKDKDLRQMLNGCTRMYDVHTDDVIGPAELEAKVGYRPDESIEVQTLIGDAIDNVPGIPGVGEKTAAKLIRKYGSADAVLKHLDDLTPKMRENFEKFGGRLATTRKLVTLITDVEFDFTPEACRFSGLNTQGLRPHLIALGFQSLLKRVGGEGISVADAKAARKLAPTKKPAHVTPAFAEGLFGSTEPRQEPGADGAAEAAAPPETSNSPGHEYQCIDTPEKLAAFIAQLKQQKRFAFDTETDNLGAMKSKLVGMSFSWAARQAFYLPVNGPANCIKLDHDTAIAAIKPIMEDATIEKIGHNVKYDGMVLRNAGVNVRGVALDTMVTAFLIDASRLQYGIDRLALDVLDFQKIPTSDLLGKGKSQRTMDCVGVAQVSKYACEDADISWRLGEFLQQRLEQLPTIKSLNAELETPLINVLAEMETNGIAVDPVVLKEQSAALGERIDVLHAAIIKAAGKEFNVDSPRQLEIVLFADLGLKPGKKTKTGYSTDVNELERLATQHPVPRLILEYRSLVKLKNTYLDNLTEYINPRTGRIHGHFNQTGAATGRLSMSDPNLQNIPIRTDEGRRIRLAFVPGDRERNVLLTADYSQIELRMLAHFTGEPGLVNAFEADEDVHQAVASEVFSVPLAEVTREQRNQAKTINFGIIYGVTAFGLSSRIEGLSTAAATQLIAAYHKKFPGIQQFFKQCVAEAAKFGYVETILGRRRPLPDINSGVMAQRSYAERAAINSVVQGSAADLIKQAMLNVYRRIKRDGRPSKMLLQVHDELVFETPEASVEAEADMVREEMTQMTGKLKLRVPLKVETGWAKNWQEVK